MALTLSNLKMWISKPATIRALSRALEFLLQGAREGGREVY